MSRTLSSALILIATFAIARPAHAQTAPQADKAQADTAAKEDASATPVRVRASHRVEVIAPGEHVETIIDRMRANSAGTQATPGNATPVERLPVRSPNLQRGVDRGASDRQRNGRAASPGAGPGSGPGPGPGATGNGPPPERR